MPVDILIPNLDMFKTNDFPNNSAVFLIELDFFLDKSILPHLLFTSSYLESLYTI